MYRQFRDRDKRRWPGSYQATVKNRLALEEDLTDLTDPRPTAQNPDGDDVFRHRLARAIQSIAIVSDKTLHRDRIEAISQQLFELWYCHAAACTSAVLVDINGVLPELAAVEDELFISDGIVAKLTRSLFDPVAEIRERAIYDLGRIAWAGQKQALVTVIDSLQHQDYYVCWIAIKALGEIATSQREAWETLQVVFAQHQDASIRQEAASALLQLRESSLAKRVFDSLAEDLHSERRDEQCLALKTFAFVAEKPIPSIPVALIARMIALLEGQDEHLIWMAAIALGKIGRWQHHQKIITAALALTTRTPYQHWIATVILRTMKSAAASSEVAEFLASALASDDLYIRWTAAEALVQIGPAAFIEEAGKALLKALQSRNEDARREAAKVIGYMGASVITTEARDILLRTIATDGRVRWAAAFALGEIATEQDEQTIAALTTALQEADTPLRREAITALAKLRATSPQIVHLLKEFLSDQPKDIKLAAMEALAKLTPAVSPDELANLLLPLISTEDVDICCQALRLLSSTPETFIEIPVAIPAVYKTLSDDREEVRRAAAAVLAAASEKLQIFAGEDGIFCRPCGG